MNEIDFDVEKNQEALRELYVALEDHQEFWDTWLSERLGFEGDFFAPAEEVQAATAMSQALLTIVTLARTKEK